MLLLLLFLLLLLLLLEEKEEEEVGVGVGVGGEGVVGLLREEEGDMILSNSIAGWMVETLLYLYLWSDRQRGYVSSMS